LEPQIPQIPPMIAAKQFRFTAAKCLFLQIREICGFPFPNGESRQFREGTRAAWTLKAARERSGE
jgi:hypothetical protein